MKREISALEILKHRLNFPPCTLGQIFQEANAMKEASLTNSRIETNPKVINGVQINPNMKTSLNLPTNPSSLSSSLSYQPQLSQMPQLYYQSLPPFAGHVFFLDMPPDDKVKKFADLLATYGGQVEERFVPNRVTHIVVNPSLKEIQAIASAKRSKKALDMAKAAKSSESSNVFEVAKQMGKTVCHVNDLVKIMKEVQAAKKHSSTPKNNGNQLQTPFLMSNSNNQNNSVNNNYAYSSQFHPQNAPMYTNGYSLFTPQSASTAGAGTSSSKRRKTESAAAPSVFSNIAPNYNLLSTSNSFRLKNSNLLMVEDMVTNCKPLVKSFVMEKRGPMGFPTLNLESSYPLVSPFFSPEEAMISWKRKLERDKETAEKEKIEANGGPFKIVAHPKKEGWCECCLMKYDDLEFHITTPKHLAFASNPSNYKDVDAYMEQMERENIQKS